MTDTPQLLLAHHLKALKLPTFLREYDKLARQCAAEGLDHIRFLLRLAELELIDRERRMVERRIKEARFAFVVLALRHWVGGRRVKVKRRSPASSRLSATAR